MSESVVHLTVWYGIHPRAGRLRFWHFAYAARSSDFPDMPVEGVHELLLDGPHLDNRIGIIRACAVIRRPLDSHRWHRFAQWIYEQERYEWAENCAFIARCALRGQLHVELVSYYYPDSPPKHFAPDPNGDSPDG
jgi:hypothetical protein